MIQMTVAECIAYVEAHLEVRYAANNRAYKSGRDISPDGDVNHSFGCAQPNVEVAFSIMDKESAGWAVNAILGDFHKGEGRILLTMPYKRRPWGVGSGKRGSWNNSRIQWEVLEPSGHTYAGGTMIGYDVAKNEAYFQRMWKMLVCWNVYVARKLDFGPDAIGDHAESYLAGMGGNHADMGHWLPKHGQSMDTLRENVRAILNNQFEEGSDMTEKEVLAIVKKAIADDKKASRYATIEDVPNSYRPTIRRLMEATDAFGKGSVLTGYDGGKDKNISTIEDNTILVDETFCRIVVVLERAGVLKLPEAKEEDWV